MLTQPTRTEPEVVEHAPAPPHLARTTLALAVLVVLWAGSPRTRMLALASGKLGEA